MERDIAEAARNIAKRWLPALIEGLNECTDEEQRTKILEFCGLGCGEPDLEKIRALKEQARDEEHLLQLMNEHILWCGEWEWVDGKIHSVCAACGCPLVVEGYVEKSPTFCLCSRGWVKAVFAEALGEEVEVELKQAIGRGDDCCEFVVVPRPRRSSRPPRSHA
jgi:predicted hydrocarbon binding protein